MLINKNLSKIKYCVVYKKIFKICRIKPFFYKQTKILKKIYWKIKNFDSNIKTKYLKFTDSLLFNNFKKLFLSKSINSLNKNNFVKNLIFNKYNQKNKNLNFPNLIPKFIIKKKFGTKFLLNFILNNNFKINKKLNFYSKLLIYYFLKKNILMKKKDKQFLNKKKTFLCNKLFNVFKKTHLIIKKNNYLAHKLIFSYKKLIIFLLENKNKIKNTKINKCYKYFFIFIVKNAVKNSHINYRNLSVLSKKILSPFIKKKIQHSNTKTNILYKKLLGLILKKGKKTVAINILENSLVNVSKKVNLSVSKIISILFNKLKASIELKKIRVRRRFHFVPFPINIKRKAYLVTKWVLLSISKNKIKSKTSKKLTSEIIKIIKNQKSLSFKTKKYNISNCFSNKSNKHFRW